MFSCCLTAYSWTVNWDKLAFHVSICVRGDARATWRAGVHGRVLRAVRAVLAPGHGLQQGAPELEPAPDAHVRGGGPVPGAQAHAHDAVLVRRAATTPERALCS